MEKDQAEPLAPALYVVATPIGNLEDLGFRALRVLRQVNWIAAEDTRVSQKLLEHYGLRAPLHSFHEHSPESRAEELAAKLAGGGAAAYVSDAGTPGLSDPGAALVRAAAARGIPIVPVPGPSAALALYSVSGFAGAEFRFRAFFPRENKERERWAQEASRGGGIQVFFESPHRIRDCLDFLAARFPAAPLVVGRELTKRFETITRGTCQSVREALAGDEPRGEYALALELPEAGPALSLDESQLRPLLAELAGLGASQKALTQVAISHGWAKNRAYALALEILKG